MKLSRTSFIENYIIKEGANILIEKITKSDVERWHKDAQAFTKNIRRMSTKEDIELVTEICRTFGVNFETFVFKQIIGSQLSKTWSDQYKDSAITVYEDEVRKTSWELTIYLQSNLPFSLERVYYSPEGVPIGGEISRKYMSFDKFKDSIYQKLSRLIREAFEKLYNLFNVETELTDLLVVENIKIGGVPTILTYVEGDEDNVRDVLKQTEEVIKDAKKLITKKGFKDIYSNLTLIVDRQRAGITKGDTFSAYATGGAAAFFDDRSMSISLPYPNLQTFIHELGHKYYYYNLQQAQRDLWKDFIEKGILNFTKDELKEVALKFTKEFFPTYDSIANNQNISRYEKEKLINKEVTNFKFKTLTEKELAIIEVMNERREVNWGFLLGAYFGDDDKEKKDFSYLVGRIEGLIDYSGYYGTGMQRDIFKIAPKNLYISEYGNANEKEAYAEAFMLYILDKYVPELVLDQFYLTKPK